MCSQSPQTLHHHRSKLLPSSKHIALSKFGMPAFIRSATCRACCAPSSLACAMAVSSTMSFRAHVLCYVHMYISWKLA